MKRAFDLVAPATRRTYDLIQVPRVRIFPASIDLTPVSNPLMSIGSCPRLVHSPFTVEPLAKPNQ